MMNTHNLDNAFSRQQGAITVFVALILMMVMTVMALTVSKFAQVEQETTGADYRAGEASEATSAGLEYALAWLDDDNQCDNCVSGVALNLEGATTVSVSIPDVAYDGGDEDPATGTGYIYKPTVTLTRGNNFADGFMLVESTLDTLDDTSAESYTESGVTITGSEQVYVTQWNQFLTVAGLNAPPVVVNGCLKDITGNPTIYPSVDGPAVLTVGPDPLLPHDWRNADAPNNFCLDPGHMGVQLCGGLACSVGDSGGDVTGSDLEKFLTIEDLSAMPEPQAWNHLFEISLPAAKAMAAAAGQSTSNKNNVTQLQPVDSDYVPFIVYTGSNPLQGEYGTADYPVVLIVSHENCPQFNGGSKIYGMLYYEDPLEKCNGMGGATVIGSGVFEGDAEKLNANTKFYSSSAAGGPLGGGPLYAEKVARIPGTWRDW